VNTGLKLEYNPDSKVIQYVTDKDREIEEFVHALNPYVSVVSYEQTEKFCAHCHTPIGLHCVQSLFNYDFYGYNSCRDYFDNIWKSQVHKELRTDLRSRFITRDQIFKVSRHDQVRIEVRFFTWIKALAVVIGKKTSEEQKHRHYRQPLMDRGRGKCEEGSEMGPPVYDPNFEDFEAMPVREYEVPDEYRENFRIISEMVYEVIQQRDAYKCVTFDQKMMFHTLCRLYNNQRAIVRQMESYGPATVTGFGIFPGSEFLEHSGIPNCEYYFDYNQRFVIRACRKIEKGEKLTIGHFPRLLEEVDQDLGDRIHQDHFIKKIKKSDEYEDEDIFIAAKDEERIR
jgi:hypothetical protein